VRTRIVTGLVMAAVATASLRVAPQLRPDPRARFLRSELATVLGAPLTSLDDGKIDALRLPRSLRRAIPGDAFDQLEGLLTLFAALRGRDPTSAELTELAERTTAFDDALRDARVPLVLDFEARPLRLTSFYVERRERLALGDTSAVLVWVRRVGGVPPIGAAWWSRACSCFLAPLATERDAASADLDVMLDALVSVELARSGRVPVRRFPIEWHGYVASELALLAREDMDVHRTLRRIVELTREPPGTDRGASLPLLFEALGVRVLQHDRASDATLAMLLELPPGRVRQAAARAYAKETGGPPPPFVREPLP
jgi:hypothetical protein